VNWALVSFWVCFLTGLAWAVFSAIMGGIFGFGHGVDLGGIGHGGADFHHEFGTAHDASGGHGEADFTAAPEAPAISPLSPAVMATFATTFGGVGVITTSMFHFPLLLSIPTSAIVGIGVAAVVFVVFYRVFESVQASSEATVAGAVGLEGEVTVAIPAEGIGEVAYVSRGGRFTAPARSEEGIEIPRHASVRITKVVGNTYYVRPLLDEQLRSLRENDTAPQDRPPKG
jgi:membrane protein implicated in regulation of membrane protease activity